MGVERVDREVRWLRIVGTRPDRPVAVLGSDPVRIDPVAPDAPIGAEGPDRVEDWFVRVAVETPGSAKPQLLQYPSSITPVQPGLKQVAMVRPNQSETAGR